MPWLLAREGKRDPTKRPRERRDSIVRNRERRGETSNEFAGEISVDFQGVVDRLTPLTAIKGVLFSVVVLHLRP